MTRLLITEAAFDRVRSGLDAMVGLDCLVMDGLGITRTGDQQVAPEEARPDCAFISNDLFFSPFAERFLAALLQSPVLAWVQSSGAGLDNPMFVRLMEKGVRLTTNHGQAIGMAEYVLWGVLDHFQGGRFYASEQAAGRWTKQISREISGTRWLIVGFGSIGEGVARRAKAFDVHVTGVRRKPEPSPYADVVTTPRRLLDHLGDSDVVVLCAPRTAETENMVGADFLAAMKPGSMLVNIGRGTLIDEEALLAALDAGKPEHVLLDVFRTEPLPAESRFWDHPRVSLTAHTSALSAELGARTDALFLDNLGRYLAGRPLLNEVSTAEVLAASTDR